MRVLQFVSKPSDISFYELFSFSAVPCDEYGFGLVSIGMTRPFYDHLNTFQRTHTMIAME